MDKNSLLKDKKEHGYENYTDNVINSCNKKNCRCTKNCGDGMKKVNKCCCKSKI